MKKKGDERQKVVELKQLVSQPQCLKLLILHTPFTLNLDSLYQCINLVKLDLSKNNLTSFPYLGDLPFLKFMFIHDNKLDIEALVGIFEEDFGKQSKSSLSKAIIWVTYWGNLNQFNARHYLINHTSVLAVDYHMVAPEQKNQVIFVDKNFIQPFDPVTNIQEIFQNRKKFNKNATEEQYMAEFWQDMARIRKKHMEINSIIKIQKVYRGWSYRLREARKKQEIIEGKKMVISIFSAWKRQIKFQKKLKAIFKKKDKEYLLLPIKQMKLEAAKRKIIAFVQHTKKKILLRKMNLKAQYKFFNVLKSNQQALRSLYSVLHLDRSSYLMIHVDGIENFKKYVIPVASSMNGGIQVPIKENFNTALRSLYQPPRKRREFLRMLQLNQKSVALQIRPLQKQVPMKKRTSSVYRVETTLSSNYNNKNIHFSALDLEKMENIQKSFRTKKQLDLNELKKVEGDRQLLKDIVRGCYFYNMGYLTNCVVPTEKINILSEYSIKKISSIIKIQRMWRGVNLRRKIRDVARKNYILNRAVVKIQRWFRNLPWLHRQLFMFQQQKNLKLFQNQSFYIRMTDYMEVVTRINQNQNDWQLSKLSFPQQNIKPYISTENKKLLISWDHQSHNEGTFINSKISKKFFTLKFMKGVFDNWEVQGPIQPGQQNKYEKCQISHLFHYRTQISTIHRRNGLYLQIKCASKYDCRLRVLALKLLTYSFHDKNTVQILPKQLINFYQSQINFKKSISNPNSIFISQNKSEFEIAALNKQNSKTYQLLTKFYINQDENKKPVKFATVLKIVIVETEKKQIEPEKKQVRSVSYNYEKFDLQNFLIAETNDIRLDKKNVNLVNHIFSANSKNKKQSLKNIKLDRKMKFKNREKVYSQHSEKKEKSKINFILGDPQFYERLTTQPDLLTHERSMGSILPEPETNKKDSLHKSDVKISDSRVVARKRMGINNESTKAQGKNIEQFTKNFINQGNFIQNQFLYGQIKRLKTEIERNSVDQATRIKTEQNQRVKYLQRFKDDKIKRAQQAHLKHKQQQFRSVIEKHSTFESKQKLKNEIKQSQYKSLPRKMRINFAEQCYPIIGKHPSSNYQHIARQE